ncbi:Hypothetical protein GbCGDNIH6_0728 [Granulibacter bethesdensis]|nr:hypothetical protein [Granulibacter bethesdensis]ASV62514.1 Hypothetical protein GbCGDNIH6_0728 [Granulibacter bethesdensis]
MRGRDWMPVLVLLGLVCLAVAGWRLFPRLQAFIMFQDCAAAGRINC